MGTHGAGYFAPWKPAKDVLSWFGPPLAYRKTMPVKSGAHSTHVGIRPLVGQNLTRIYFNDRGQQS